MNGYASAYNGTGKSASGTGRFRHTAVNQPLDELEQQLPGRTFKQGETYSYSTGDWGTYFNFSCGTLTAGNEWVCNAYLRIQISQEKTDDWLAEDTNTFDEND